MNEQDAGQMISLLEAIQKELKESNKQARETNETLSQIRNALLDQNQKR